MESSLVVTIVDFGLSQIATEDGTVIHGPANQLFMASRDTEHLAGYLRKIRISSWADSAEEEEDGEHLLDLDLVKQRKSLKRSLMQRMTRGASPHELTLHAFFDSMRSAPISEEPVTPKRSSTPKTPEYRLSTLQRRQSTCLTPLAAKPDPSSRRTFSPIPFSPLKRPRIAKDSNPNEPRPKRLRPSKGKEKKD